MTLNVPTALWLTQVLLSAGIILQGLECLVARRGFGALTRELSWVFGVRIGLCVLLVVPVIPVSPWGITGVHLVLLATAAWLVVRLHGPLCGGSDSMHFQVQLGLLAGSLGFVVPWLPKAGLAWIAAQSALSYFLAGAAKLRNRRWRNGAALETLLKSDGPYSVPPGIRRWASTPAACALLAWILIGLELAFPTILITPGAGKLGLIAVGFIFHALNAVTLGLNRFIWAWAATYPALLANYAE